LILTIRLLRRPRRLLSCITSNTGRNIIEHLDPIAGAIAAIDALKKAGHELYIITARSDRDIEATELWLARHFFSSWPETFKGVHYGQSRAKDPAQRRLKSALCRELGIELMIDDTLSNARDCAEAGIRVLLLDRPWNQVGDAGGGAGAADDASSGAGGSGEPPLPAGVERVRGWEEVVENIKTKL
jgi:phosphoglycolate phosphatase-like HAD superfamily hydrolase